MFTQTEIDRLLSQPFPPAQRIVLRNLLGKPGEGTGTASGTGVTATEERAGLVRITRLSLNAVPQDVGNGEEYQSTLVYTFPAGAITVLGSVASLAETTTSAIASTLNAGVTGALALGTAAASNVSLTGTMVNLLPSTAFLSSTVINVAAAAVTGLLAAPASFNGTVTPTPVYFNSAFATTTDVDADATITWTGSIYLAWLNLGDL